ncbi:LysM peptidoglycan-binding domain-containing protein [Tepidiforma thermophila]|uniref:Soluble lytic murein transglycosylase-like protein n=1 Tax=Tepidiforma thermophila (strain KCTC 52669 / CGMCC 1.13589 / G233) TaxID=2761530 RepID=A0A2A9HEK4_TEPT2|nr:LysM peptidoglycan-binding domain-containing protein [Tepidiforma thermophila]PFG73572.1 soluble lytic murein transglycosylase-like protein [Tepidiforma thermophila]
MLPHTPHAVANRAPFLCRVLLAMLAASVAVPAAFAHALTHEVQPGETLSAIALRYGVDVDALAAANGIANPDLVFAGQLLTIAESSPAVPPPGGAVAPPAARSYVVEPGDTLSAIALAHGTTVHALAEANGIDDHDRIFAGQRLILPAPTRAPAAAGVSRPAVEALLRAAAAEYGIPPSVLLGLAWLESGWNQAMVSPAGAVGIMQLMPATAEWGLEYLAPGAVNWRTDPADNIRLGAAVFAHMLWQAGGDLEIALAFYYQGWWSIEQFGIFDETLQYVANVLAIAAGFDD